MGLKKRLARAFRAFVADDPGAARTRGPRTQYAYLGPDLALARMRNGHWLYVDPEDRSMSAQLIKNGFWEASVYDTVLGLLSPGDTVVEVGANLGYYTIAMASAVGAGGSVIAFEANPRLADMVRLSAGINDIADRVTVVPKAAMDRAGAITFVTSRKASGGGFVSTWDQPAYEDAVVIPVEAVPLDSLDVQKVDMLRVDAEGSEPFILRGAERLLRANADITVCIEWCVVQMASRTSMDDFVAWLTSLGFGFWKIETDTSLTSIPAETMSTIDTCDVVLARRPPRPRGRRPSNP